MGQEKEIQEKLHFFIKKINGDIKLLPEINKSNYNAKPFIEIDRYGLNYVCYEREEELFRKLPSGVDELIYLVFDDITSKIALDWEIKNRKNNEDSRRGWFSKSIELMYLLKNEFGVKKETEIKTFLKTHKFNDKIKRCSNCFYFNVDEFESQNQFNQLDLRLTKKANNAKTIRKMNTSENTEFKLNHNSTESYLCNECETTWVLSAPNFPWKGYMKRKKIKHDL